MYFFFIVLIIIAAILLILAVLMQSPKGGMAANFGVSNEVMGVRQTADFLEKSTWTLAVVIVALSLAATMSIPSANIRRLNSLEESIQQSVEGGQDFTPLQTPSEIPLELPSEMPVAAPSEQAAPAGDQPSIPAQE